jgi:hypothetical protein
MRGAYYLQAMPGWRNGRRARLKICCPRGRAGSSPALGTSKLFLARRGYVAQLVRAHDS